MWTEIFVNITLFQVSDVQYASCVQRYLYLAFVVTRYIPSAVMTYAIGCYNP